MFNNLKIGKQSQAKETETTPKKDMTIEEGYQTINPPENNQAEFSEHSSTDSAPNHFDDLINDGQNIDSDAPDTPTAQMLDHDAFHKVFCMILNTSSHMAQLKSLAVDEQDNACVDCTKAIYDTIYETPMLHFMLKPNGKWMGRIFAIGAFTIPMAQNVSAELAQRNAPKSEKSSGNQNAQQVKSLRELAEEQGK